MPAPEPCKPQAAAAEEADRLHGVFMAKTQQLLTGELEISAYEDQVSREGSVGQGCRGGVKGQGY